MRFKNFPYEELWREVEKELIDYKKTCGEVDGLDSRALARQVAPVVYRAFEHWMSGKEPTCDSETAVRSYLVEIGKQMMERKR